MKKSMILLGMLSIGYANAQEGNVGINTEEPKATLEIVPNATNLAGTTNEGLLIPRLSKARVAAIASGNLVEGTKVYVTDEVTAVDTQFIGTGKGFYFYNGTKWVKQLASDTDAGATQNIYNTDGTLTANRIVNLDNKRITFDGDGKVRVGSIENENSGAKFGVITPLDNRAVRNTLFFAPNLSEGNSMHIALGKGFGRNNNGSIDFIYRGNNSNKNGIGFNTDSRSNGTNPNFILFAQADGNVGINNNNPTQKLDVVGNGQFNNPEGSVNIRLNPTGENSYGYIKLMRGDITRWDFGMDGTTETGANDGSDYYISSTLDDGITYTRRFTIKRESGNVGIGIQHPTEKLEVNGNARIVGLKGAGDRVVYADENGVLKTGSATSTATPAVTIGSTTAMECNADNRGKMNFIPSTDNAKSDVFGICMRNKDGNYYWAYMVGGNNPTNGTGAFGSGL